MNQEIKTAWFKKMDEVNQGIGSLRSVSPDGTESFCCWGVLCEVFVERGKLERQEYTNTVIDHTRIGYGLPKAPPEHMAVGYPDPEVLEWAGIDRQAIPREDAVMYLANVNDNGSNFEYIKGEIERWL